MSLLETPQEPEVIEQKKEEGRSIEELYMDIFFDKYKFSSREKEIVERLISGEETLSICSSLFISENTVKSHIRNILRKTNCKNRTLLLALFLREANEHSEPDVRSESDVNFK